MPTSRSDKISTILGMIEKLTPNSILDIGVGFGKWGVLCREYLDVNRAAAEGRAYSDWKLRLVGIEAYEGYRNPAWGVYDEMLIGDVRELVESLGHVDLVLGIDVLEHMPDYDVAKLMLQIRMRSRWRLWCVPARVRPQGAVFGNQYERHFVRGWRPTDFAGYKRKDVGKSVVFTNF